MGLFRNRHPKGSGRKGGEFGFDIKHSVDAELSTGPDPYAHLSDLKAPRPPGRGETSVKSFTDLLNEHKESTIGLSEIEARAFEPISRVRTQDMYVSDLHDFLAERTRDDHIISMDEIRDEFDRHDRSSRSPVPEKWVSNPPVEAVYPEGRVRSRKFLNDKGKPTNGPNGEPAVEEFYESGTAKKRFFYTDGKLNNGPNGEPGFETFHENGQVAERRLREQGSFNDGPNGEPAIQEWDESGQLRSVRRHINGSWRDGREGEPHAATWHPNGERATEKRISGGGIPGQDGYTREWDENGNLTRAK